MFRVEQAQMLASLVVLTLATIQDINEREVDDVVWIVGLLVGVSLDICLFLKVRPPLESIVQYVRFLIPFLIIIIGSWRLKLMGEADILAFITLAILQPVHPYRKGMFPPAFCTLLHSNVLILLVPLYFLAWNLALMLKGENIFDGFEESTLRKFLASLLAIPIRAEKADKFKFFSVAQNGTSPRKKFKLISALSIPETKEELPKTEEPLVWICPSIPMIPFILAGYLMTLWLGDPILLLIQLIS